MAALLLYGPQSVVGLRRFYLAWVFLVSWVQKIINWFKCSNRFFCALFQFTKCHLGRLYVVSVIASVNLSVNVSVSASPIARARARDWSAHEWAKTKPKCWTFGLAPNRTMKHCSLPHEPWREPASVRPWWQLVTTGKWSDLMHQIRTLCCVPLISAATQQ